MKDAYYFSHDSNARNDTKVLSMRCDYGLEGYGMYWIIVEALRDETDYKLKLDKCTYRALAMQMHSTTDAVEQFINDCIVEYNLFNSDTESFWAESLLRRMSKFEDIREKRRMAANKRWKKDEALDMQMHDKSTANEVQLDAKESKVKESKVKESKMNIYNEIFKHWITQEVVFHKQITPSIIKSMDNALKEYSIVAIKDSISLYGQAYHSDFFYSYKFTLEKFLKQGNGIKDWAEEGQMYENYMAYLEKQKPKDGKSNNWSVDAS